MVLALLLSLAVPAPSEAGVAAVRDDLPVQVWLNQDNTFRHGDRAQVHVRVAEDGYLLVFRADADGRVRVLFPLDPGNDNFLRGGKTVEIHGRGDREAFVVNEGDGTGKVLAAWSPLPFQFADLARGDHWDYRAHLLQPASGDTEAALLDLIEHMAGANHFDYDVATYTVEAAIASTCFGCSASWGYGSWGYGFGAPRSFYSLSLAFGDPFFFQPVFFRARCFDPFFFDPFFCDPFFVDPFFFHRRFFFPPVFVSRPTVIVLGGRTGVVGGIPHRRGAITATGPRRRVPTGALLRRPAPATALERRRERMDRSAAPLSWDRRPRLELRRPAQRIEEWPGAARPWRARGFVAPRRRP